MVPDKVLRFIGISGVPFWVKRSAISAFYQEMSFVGWRRKKSKLKWTLHLEHIHYASVFELMSGDSQNEESFLDWESSVERKEE